MLLKFMFLLTFLILVDFFRVSFFEGLEFVKIFQGLCLFGGLRLFIWGIFPGSMLIWGSTLIRKSRVPSTKRPSKDFSRDSA